MIQGNLALDKNFLHFQQDGTSSQYAATSRHWLNINFQNKSMGKIAWSPRHAIIRYFSKIHAKPTLNI